MNQIRDCHGKRGIWYLVSNRSYRAQAANSEYGHGFGCEEGFRDAKWLLGFKEARVQRLGRGRAYFPSSPWRC